MLKSAICYVHGTRKYGVTYKHQQWGRPSELEVYIDDDFAGDGLDFMLMKRAFLTNNVHSITWRLENKAMVEMSTAKQEYISMSQTIKNFKLLRKLAIEIHIPIRVETPVWCYNQAATQILATRGNKTKKVH